MCWFKKKKIFTGILTQDVFSHAISYDPDKFTIYLEEMSFTFSKYQVIEMKNRFKIGFGVLITIEMKKDEVTNIAFKNIFKIADSAENNSITAISFFYRRGVTDIYRRTVTKYSIQLKGFQSAAVTKPWFYINEIDDFIIIDDNTKLFYDVMYMSEIDFSFPDVKINDTGNIENPGDHSFRVDGDDDGLPGLGF